MLRTSRGPLAPVWRLAYGTLARGVATYLRGWRRTATVYLRGSLATEQAVFGVSDLDVEVVADSPADGAKIKARSDALQRRSSLAEKLLSVSVYDIQTFDRALTCLTQPVRPSYFGLAHDLHGTPIETRPGLSGPAQSWRRISGKERRPPMYPLSAQQQRVAAWLELQHWWRYALNACLEPPSLYTPYLYAKLMAEPARIWLLLEHGELIDDRRDALRQAMSLLPAERGQVQEGLYLLDSLHRSPSSSLEAILPWLVRMSDRIAAKIALDIEPLGTTPVDLWPGRREMLATQAQDTADLLPLCDWRARCFRPAPDETFRVVDGDPGRRETVVAASARARTGSFAALRTAHCLLFPATGVLRAIQCRANEPVSIAIANGQPRALFPNAEGWSADHAARREVAEHRKWLSARRRPATPAHSVAVLLGAARAAFFLETLRAGAPILPLTCDAAAQALTKLDPASRSVAISALECYVDYRRGGAQPPAKIVTELEAAIRRQRWY